MGSFFDTLLAGTLHQWASLILPSQRIFYLYLASAFVIAAITYFWFARRAAEDRPDGIEKGLLGYLFDPNIWWHKSARQDYLFFFVNGLIYYGIIGQLMIGGHVFYNAMGVGWESLFGLRGTPVFEPNALSALAYTIVFLLAVDLAVWVTHYLQHKVQVLWQFHQVHHSAEVLTPATVYRMHPVDLFFTGLVSVTLIAIGFSGFVYLTGSEPQQQTVMGVNILLFTFYLVGYNLRHSHIWLSYPPWLSYILISPAQHQTHHSIDAKHYDRNFGLVFAFWDWLFGTLYVPRGYEKLEFGIAKEEPNPFGSVQEIYLKPFVGAWRILAPEGASALRRITVPLFIGLAVGGYTTFQYIAKATASEANLPSFHLEELTWTEVDLALAEGYRAILIPTGGVEQNGPHMILGKHNHVARAAAERIAQTHGQMLVAPVIAHVPEGAIAPAPTGHMRWPGTISLPEDVFEDVLEATARSLAAHGFETIYFIGDSLLNQEPQARVAARLDSDLSQAGTRVFHVGDYYGANGQIDALLEQGFSEGEIGGHAGIRDTSELLAVHPGGIRRHPVPAPAGRDAGYGGAPSKATAAIGQEMLRLKVDAALAQIERLSDRTLANR